MSSVVRRGIASLAAVVCGIAVLLAAGGCDKRKKAPEVTGLAAVPQSAQVIVSADVARVASSPLVRRAVETLLLGDAELATRWQRLQDSCKLDLHQLTNVLLAIGPHPGPDVGTGPVLMVVTGKLVETELAACVRAMVGQGGGTLTAKDLAGRTLYQAKDGNRTMYFAFGRPDTVVLGSNEAYVTEALGPGKKATDNAELVRWIELVDRKAPLWAAGKVDERVRTGLVKVTNGQLSAGPTAMVVAIDPSDGAKIELGAVMASSADAKTLESFANTQLGLMTMAAQAKSLGAIVDKIAISSEGEVVRFQTNLSMSDVNQVISVLDGGGITAQDSPPAPGPGSAGP